MATRRDPVGEYPVLVPLHGNLDKKPRLLDRDVTAVGRARGSDLCLDGAEISTLHCILYRTPGGLRVRDCGSRTGTRVNGTPVKTAVTLQDGDILQIGTFSFEIKVPARPVNETGPDPTVVQHWFRSRRRLAVLALRLRRRLRTTGGPGPAVDPELAVREQSLRDHVRECDERAGQLQEVERELERDRAALAREQEAHRTHVQRVDADIADRLDQADKEIRARWTEFQQRCQAEEARLRQQADALAATPPPSAAPPAPEPIDDRRAELEILARQLAQGQEQLLRDQQELTRMKDQCQADHHDALAKLAQQREALAQQEASLRAQRTEMMRMVGDLKRMQAELIKNKADVPALQAENEQLRQLVAEYEHQLAALAERPAAEPAPSAELNEVRAENELLRELLQEKEQYLAELRDRPAPVGPSEGGAEMEVAMEELNRMQAENETLKRLLQEKDQLVKELHQKPTPKAANELESYELELNQFRAQLEADRAKLGAEIDQLRQRNEELDEATREMEMQLSRERAELARERTRIDRMREEMRAEIERMQRDGGVRESLQSVQKLREEITKRPAQDARLNDRLRSMRNGLSDTPT